MTTITINLPDDRLQKLNEIADRYKVAPEDVIRASLDDLLSKSDDEFRKALSYVLNKNRDLYRRLA
jgi:antitoxin FitA